MIMRAIMMLAAAPLTTVMAATFCTKGSLLCFTSTPVSTTGMQFTVTSRVNGWVGIGFSKDGMSNADIIMMYIMNGKGIISDRSSNGEVTPTIDRSQNIIDPSVSSNKVFKFTRSLNTGDPADWMIVRGNMPMIWAYSDTPVTDELKIGVHDSRGSMQIDLFSNEVIMDSSLDWKTAMVTHGLVMVIGWALFAAGGVFVARYLKPALGVWWYRVHVALMILNALLTTVGFVLAVLVTTSGQHFDGLHQIFGLIIFIGVWLQSFLGQVINHLFDPQRRSIPWWDRAHWWFGRLILLLALVNVFLGLDAYAKTTGQSETVLMAVYGAYIALVLLTFALAHWKMGGQTHHVDLHASDEDLSIGSRSGGKRLGGSGGKATKRRHHGLGGDGSMEMNISAPQPR